jgi:NAD(P)H-flavin reductase/ferredoxin
MNRSPAPTRAPSQPDGAQAAQGYAITVTDADSQAAFSCLPGETVLFAGQAAGWDLPYECAGGGCGTCRAQLLTGEVASFWPDATGLTERDRRRGNRILLCQSRPTAACTLRSQAPLRRRAEELPRPGRHESRVTGTDLLTPDMMILEVDCGQHVPYLAGQFVILEMPDGTRRPYSMSGRAGPGSARLELLVRSKPAGAASRWLFQRLAVGSRLIVEGPYGRAHAQSPAGRPVVCVAGGSGLGQVLTIAEHCLAQDATRPLSFYYGARSVADLVLRDRFCALRGRGADVIAVAEITGAGTGEGRKTGQGPGWGPVRTGLVIDAVAADHNDLTGHDLYVAGPTAMVDALLAALVRTGRAAADRVFFDRFWT